MNKVSLLIKPVIISLLFALVTTQANAIAPTGTRGKPTTQVTSVMRSCEARVDVVKKRMIQLTDMVTNMEETFDKIATRVQNFYSNTVLPSGHIVANYEALVADISAKKALVDAEITSTKADVTAFNCTTGDPKTHMSLFRVNMQQTKTALKNYRTSVRNLIVAVHKAAEGLTPTPTPSI